MPRLIRTTTRHPAHEAQDLAGELIPFRAPHHTTSEVGLLDELRLAVGGVLYLDDLAEFRSSTLHSLSRRLERGGPLPLAVVVDCSNPFSEDGPEPNLEVAKSYQERIEAAHSILERGCRQ